MRFEKGHKAATRRRIVDVASRGLRRDGIAAAGMMEEAGLTKGAFSPHFESKDALVREALASALGDQQHHLEDDQLMDSSLEGAIRGYLNRAHLEAPADGCPSAALLPEIARQSPSIRQDYEKALRSYVGTLAALIPGADSAANHHRATAIFGLMVGTLQLARAVPSASEAERILETGIEAALYLARTGWRTSPL